MKRVSLAVLISLAVLAGVYTTVLGAALGTSRGAIRTNAGLMVDLSRPRSQAVSLNEYYADVEKPFGFHDCGGGDGLSDPND
jgi:hypothetical protein